MNNAQIKAFRQLTQSTATIGRTPEGFTAVVDGVQIGTCTTYAGARELLDVFYRRADKAYTGRA